MAEQVIGENGMQVLRDPMSPWPSAALIATLGLARGAPEPGEALAPFWHWMHFLEAAPREALGRDGHPAPGRYLLPDTGLPRRMWAGGRLVFEGPLPLGREAVRRSHVSAVTRRSGRTGPLAFVTVHHAIEGAAGLAVTEEQDVVYREDPAPGAPRPAPEMAPVDETAGRRWALDPTVLFRYSALTFNGHRIHYDAAYSREVEGHAGLVVHGPLLATLLLDLAREMAPARFAPHFIGRFAFRARAAVFVEEAFEACGRAAEDGLALWIRGGDGRLAMTAELSWGPGGENG
ncbi:MAG: MaoC family dehydratase N-terminal domain-containing protein [Pseudomonadota bacterium]